MLAEMNKEEEIARTFLASLRLGEPVYEPDGNTPPDFLLNDLVAVEVRRLNRHHFEKPIASVEQEHFRLTGAVSDVLEGFDTDAIGESYRVVLTFNRPIGNLRRIRDNAKRAIRTFLIDPKSAESTYSLSETVRMEVVASGRRDSERFRIGAVSNFDDGSWAVPVYIENLKHCLEEKERKLGPYKKRYAQWWLVLIDAIFGIAPGDIPKVLEGVAGSTVFDRIIVIEYDSGNKLFEVRCP